MGSTESISRNSKNNYSRGFGSTSGIKYFIFPVFSYRTSCLDLYLYEPNDNGFNTNKVLSDSCLINFNMDGPYPILIDSVKQIGNTALHLFTKTYYKTDVDTISIYIIDFCICHCC